MVSVSESHAPDQVIAAGRPAASLAEAVLQTVLYADIFDYPLTRDEIHSFLLAPGGSPTEVDGAVDYLLNGTGLLEMDGTFVYRAGRSGLAAVRQERRRHAERLWRRARFYAGLMWALPYVRMVAITGALAMDNVVAGDDIDFLVVTEPGRLWMTRGMLIALTRLVRLFGDTLCPNYLISSRVLGLDQRNLYVAHELAQMVPLHGASMARSLWAENAWCRELLPNARCAGLDGVTDSLPRGALVLKRLGQRLLGLPPGDAIERWEQRRKTIKLSRLVPPEVRETLFTADICKGHHSGHGARIMELLRSRRAESLRR